MRGGHAMIPRYAARWLWMRAGPFWSGGESVLLLVRRAKPSLRVGNWRMGFQTTNLESRVTSDTAQYGTAHEFHCYQSAARWCGRDAGLPGSIRTCRPIRDTNFHRSFRGSRSFIASASDGHILHGPQYVRCSQLQGDAH